ncbi:hypothetical protein [Nonomuraea longispora]|uniref:hypothetical protein n=1 Tax=Nonomuraea longispora TaxID=1848320 RepID=UPI001FECA4A2|nr:hypothetical protein [Nonomuraea longispora]
MAVFISGFALTYVVRSEGRVDAIMVEDAKAGATILKPAGALPWGGYGGSFADPDGHSQRARGRTSPTPSSRGSGARRPGSGSVMDEER